MKIFTDSGYDNTCYPNHWYTYIYMGDFTTPHSLFCCYWARNSIKQCFYVIFVTPVNVKYIFLAFKYDGDHFRLPYLNNSTMDLKIVQ